MGKLNTAASLLASLQKATGFKSYKVYCDGKEFDPDEAEVCKSLDDLNLKGLFWFKRRDDLEGSPGHSSGRQASNQKSRNTLMIFGYLSMHDKLLKRYTISW